MTLPSSGTGSDSSGSNSTSESQSKDIATKRSQCVIYGRGAFILFLLIVAAILGFLAFFFLSESENVLVEEQYYSMTASALTATQTLAVSLCNVVHLVFRRSTSCSLPLFLLLVLIVLFKE